MINITARHIESLLAERHKADFFASQVKTGATHTNSDLLILDGWAMKKSWANPLSIGYEIKISRSDFLSDRKWHRYMPYCNEFYFVTKPGIIRQDEIPPEVGLILCSTTGTTLLT